MFFSNFTHLQEIPQSPIQVQRWTQPIPSSDSNLLERLGEARYRNREEGFAIIVEGPRDKAALLRLGFVTPSKRLTGWGMDRLAAYLYETYGTRTTTTLNNDLADGLGPYWRKTASKLATTS